MRAEKFSGVTIWDANGTIFWRNRIDSAIAVMTYRNIPGYCREEARAEEDWELRMEADKLYHDTHTSDIEYETYRNKSYEIFASMASGKTREVVRNVLANLNKASSHDVSSPMTKSVLLLRAFANSSYANIVVTTYPREIMESLGDIHDMGLVFVIGSELETTETQDGTVYTGQYISKIEGSESKRKALWKLRDEYSEIPWENSWAFGNTEDDVPLLEIARYPVAINPDDNLARIARNRGWLISNIYPRNSPLIADLEEHYKISNFIDVSECKDGSFI